MYFSSPQRQNGRNDGCDEDGGRDRRGRKAVDAVGVDEEGLREGKVAGEHLPDQGRAQQAIHQAVRRVVESEVSEIPKKQRTVSRDAKERDWHSQENRVVAAGHIVTATTHAAGWTRPGYMGNTQVGREGESNQAQDRDHPSQKNLGGHSAPASSDSINRA